jgi:nucleotide-binding universal stress UspA family protein
VHRTPRGIRRVLVALDGSSEGETILAHLNGFISSRTAIVLVHVIPTPPPDTDVYLQMILRFQEDAESYLGKVAERIPQGRSRIIVETGDPVERILSVAQDEDVDVLAMTTRARNRLASMLLGSVAREVVRRAGRPVLLVRPGVPPPQRAPQHLLVPLDGPEGAGPLLRVVESLAKQSESKVTLLHVLPAPRVADPVTGFNPIILKPIELPKVLWLDPLVDLLAHHGVPATKRVLVGEPDVVLLRESREQDVDLIALRTRARRGIARLVLGSVAESVLQQAERPVLLFHRVED